MIWCLFGMVVWYGWMVAAILASAGVLKNAPYDHWFVAVAFFTIGTEQFIKFCKKLTGEAS
jgi:hypothetical protein